MKLKFISNFDNVKLKKGYEVEVDKIKFDLDFVGGFAVRVISVWKRPRWLAISWFVDVSGIFYGTR